MAKRDGAPIDGKPCPAVQGRVLVRIRALLYDDRT